MKKVAGTQEGMLAILRRELKRKRYDGVAANELLHSLKSFAAYFYPCHPRELTETDIRGYLLYRKTTKPMRSHEAAGLLKALRFLYGEMYGRRMHLGRGPESGHPAEISARISTLGNAKHRALLSLVCSAGLRIGEAVTLRASDVDVEKHQVRIRSTRGKKDRLAPLPAGALEELEFYFKESNPTDWLFAGQRRGGHISQGSAQKIFREAIGLIEQRPRSRRSKV